MEQNNKEKVKALKIIAEVFKIAYDIFGNLLIGVLLGYYLDKFLKSLPLFTIIGRLLGIILGFKALMKLGRNKGD